MMISGRIFLRIKKYILKKISLTETDILLIISIFVGIVGGFGAVIFRWMINNFTEIFFTGGSQVFSFLGSYYVIIIPAIGGLVVGLLIHFYAREAKGHGVPEVMSAVATKGGRIRPRVAVVKSIASSICIGSGGSVGREGPIVQIGSSVGSSIGQFFRLSDARIKNLVACGAAAGIAATFNAPIAGVFFASEVILGEFGIITFSSIVLSSVTATMVSRSILGNSPAFTVPTYTFVNPIEILFYIILGFLAAVVGLLFIKILYKSEDIFDRIKIPEYIKPLLGGLMIGSIGLFVPEIFGVGYGVVELGLTGEILVGTLLILVFVKIIATSLTLGSGGSGGIFAPSLFIGAMLGGTFGFIVHSLFPSITASSGAYALVGMGALFAGVAHAPITTIIILFEMTGDYKIILPLMTASVISVVIINRLVKENIYTLKLARQGINIRSGKDINIMRSILVKDAMNKEYSKINQNSSVKEAYKRMRSDNLRNLVVTNRRGRVVGMIIVEDVRDLIAKKKGMIRVKNIVIKDLIVCYPDENLDEVLKKMGSRYIGRLPVVDRKNPTRIVGIITRKNVINAYNKSLD